MTDTKLDSFTKAYLDAALWSSTCEPFGECANCDRENCILYWNPETREHELCDKCCTDPHDSPYEPPMDDNYSISDIAPATLAAMLADCAKFQAEQAEWITDENCLNGSCDYIERAGHDFWLTRCGHGSGFWDGDWSEPAATKLTDAAHAFGEVNLYVGDDGLIYQ